MPTTESVGLTKPSLKRSLDEADGLDSDENGTEDAPHDDDQSGAEQTEHAGKEGVSTRDAVMAIFASLEKSKQVISTLETPHKSSKIRKKVHIDHTKDQEVEEERIDLKKAKKETKLVEELYEQLNAADPGILLEFCERLKRDQGKYARARAETSGEAQDECGGADESVSKEGDVEDEDTHQASIGAMGGEIDLEEEVDEEEEKQMEARA